MCYNCAIAGVTHCSFIGHAALAHVWMPSLSLQMSQTWCCWLYLDVARGLAVLGRAGPYVGQAMTPANGGGIALRLSWRLGMPQRLQQKETHTQAVQCFLQMCEDSPTPMVLSGRCC